jgi:hypothetical protein
MTERLTRTRLHDIEHREGPFAARLAGEALLLMDERDAARAENVKLREVIGAYFVDWDAWTRLDPGEQIQCRDRLLAALAEGDDE